MPIRLTVVSRLVCVAALLLAGTRLPLARPPAAGAEVTRVEGYAAVVDGWRSWYGSYGMGDLGPAWCIDHGIRAPDPAYAYVPTGVDVDAATQRGIAWILGTHGRSPDRVTAAALMLAVHDLMGAVYPSGRLDVDGIGVERLSGFEGAEATVLGRARELKAEALSRGRLEPPLALSATPPAGVDPGETGALDVRLTDAKGAGVGGVLLHAAVTGAVLTGPVEAVTDDEGRVRFPFTAVAGENRFEVTGTVADLGLHAFAPTRRAAQRVARPAVVDVRAATSFTAVVRQRLTIVKRGDAEVYLPVAGARFEVRRGDDVVRELTVGRDGRGRAELAAGRYEVHEVAPPDGYAPGGPWNVDLTGDDAVLDVLNEARRGSAVIRKVDAVSGAPVAGAELLVTYDRDGDGDHETEVTTVTSTGEEPAITLADLLPGSYAVEEVAPPPGYAAGAPVSFSVAAGQPVEVEVANQPRSTVAFEKVPAGLHDPEAMTLAGAAFVVAGVGTCTTDAAGECSLPDPALDGGREYCWEETEAPPGWARAEGGCFVAPAEPGGVHVVTVEEPSRYAPVSGRKTDAETGEPVGGAVYDLYRVDDDERGPAPARSGPGGAVALAGHTWVGRAESDVDGALAWPAQIAGYTYCAFERHAPPGYLPDSELTCTAEPVTLDGARLDLADRPLPTVVVERTVVERETAAPVVHAAPAPAPAPTPTPSSPPPRPRPPLAATGFDSGKLAALGLSLVLLGLALTRNLRQ